MQSHFATAWSASHTMATTGFLETHHFLLCPGIRWGLLEDCLCGKAQVSTSSCRPLIFTSETQPCSFTSAHNLSEKPEAWGPVAAQSVRADSGFSCPELLMLVPEPPSLVFSSQQGTEGLQWKLWGPTQSPLLDQCTHPPAVGSISC